ncbi:MAG TPA: shikimate kinase [Actinomycetales bacterium]|nr:shikimate kinase [Actinomycetales bacterium]
MSVLTRPVAVLVGLPGAGKTTIGRKLARRLDVGFHDTDQMIEELEGRAIPEIFATDGEPAFRAIEERVVGEALETVDGVLSLGGGAILSEVTRERLRGHRVVHLTIGVAEGVRRSAGSTRPLLSGGDVTARYQALLTERAPLYREVAWTTVTTERRSSGKVVTDIVDRLESGDPHARGGGVRGGSR